MMEFLVEAVEEKTTLQLNSAGCTVECIDFTCDTMCGDFSKQ